MTNDSRFRDRDAAAATKAKATARMAELVQRTKAGHELTATDREVFDAAEAEVIAADEAMRSFDRHDSMPAQLRRAIFGESRTASLEKFMSKREYELDLAGHVKGRVEKRDIYTTTTGAPVPTLLANEVVRRLIEGSGVLAAGPRIIRTAGGETYTLPKITTYGTASIISEGSAIGESDPTMADVEFKAHKFSLLCQTSYEMLADAGLDFESVLGDALGAAVTQAVAPKLANGTGTVEPTGLMNGGYATAVTGGTGVSGKPTYDNLVDVYFDLESPYRTNAAWIMSDATMAAVAKIKDTQGMPLLMPAMSAAAPTTLFGKPVYTDNNVDDAAVNKTCIFFGDVGRAYGVRFAGPLDLSRSDDFAYSAALSTFRVIQRLDGQPIDLQAARFYRGGTA